MAYNSSDKKKQYKQVVTEKGEALFPHLATPETYEGKEIGYTITMKFSPVYTTKLMEMINNEMTKAMEENPGQKWSKEPFCGYKEDKNGDIVFKFKTSSSIKLRDGTVVNRNIPVFDGYGNRVEDVSFGNGSICKVAFQMVPFYSSKLINGVSLRLVAVQLLDRVDYNGGHSAASYGFTTEEGSYNSHDEIGCGPMGCAVPFIDSEEEEEDTSEF